MMSFLEQVFRYPFN